MTVSDQTLSDFLNSPAEPDSFERGVVYVRRTLPDRFEVREGSQSARIAVEPLDDRYGMLLSSDMLARIESLGFTFESTARHRDDSYANHWFRFEEK